MWFDKEKLARVLKANGLTLSWLTDRLGISRARIVRVLSGVEAADYSLAKELLAIIGYEGVIRTIDWRLTRYACI